jgi:hypothetical protein
MSAFNTLRLTFDIWTDDKEKQDGIMAAVYDRNGHQLFNDYLCYPAETNGDDSDQNRYYWPSSGPGKHPHVFDMRLAAAISDDQFSGALLDVVSGFSHFGDFQSWNAHIWVTALDATGAETPHLDMLPDMVVQYDEGIPAYTPIRKALYLPQTFEQIRSRSEQLRKPAR